MVVFDKPFTYKATVGDNEIRKGETEAQEDHTGAIIGFSTRRGELVHARVASSFISPEQAEQNLKELGDRSFDQIADAGRKTWNEVLGRIQVNDDNIDKLRTFYSCVYRNAL